VPSVDTFDLHEKVVGVVSGMKDAADSRGVVVDVSGECVRVCTDAKQCTILLSNLVSNAVTYSYEGGAVRVSVEVEGANAVVTIADEGIGISENKMDRIFDDYFRAPEALEVNSSSTGLGLAIVRQVARNLGLTVRVTSVQGRGTTFAVHGFSIVTETGGDKSEGEAS
jgi:signal transduction histidine kinase